MTKKVFFSYAPEDQLYLGLVVQVLRKRGLIVTDDFTVIDPLSKSLGSGEYVRESLKKQIQAAGIVVVVATDKSASSQWVNYEVGMADALDKPMIVIGIQGSRAITDFLSNLSKFEFINAQEEVDAIENVSKDPRAVQSPRELLKTHLKDYDKLNPGEAMGMPRDIVELLMDSGYVVARPTGEPQGMPRDIVEFVKKYLLDYDKPGYVLRPYVGGAFGEVWEPRAVHGLFLLELFKRLLDYDKPGHVVRPAGEPQGKIWDIVELVKKRLLDYDKPGYEVRLGGVLGEVREPRAVHALFLLEFLKRLLDYDKPECEVGPYAGEALGEVRETWAEDALLKALEAVSQKPRK